uniref:C2H2-type domain-containing protein n=1 Tax=Elaeophora elaphi TaxID=1147741 RepID=A0A0R3RMD5_9BILA
MMTAANNVAANEKRFECNICSKQFGHKQFVQSKHLRDHKKKIYTKKKECNPCGKGFKHRKSLQNHEHLHKDVKPSKCDVCGQKFIRNFNLKNI